MVLFAVAGRRGCGSGSQQFLGPRGSSVCPQCQRVAAWVRLALRRLLGSASTTARKRITASGLRALQARFQHHLVPMNFFGATPLALPCVQLVLCAAEGLHGSVEALRALGRARGVQRRRWRLPAHRKCLRKASCSRRLAWRLGIAFPRCRARLLAGRIVVDGAAATSKA